MYTCSIRTYVHAVEVLLCIHICVSSYLLTWKRPYSILQIGRSILRTEYGVLYIYLYKYVAISKEALLCARYTGKVSLESRLCSQP